MRTNFYPIRQFDVTSAAGSALGAASPVGLGLSAAQTALGIFQTIKANADMKKYLDQRRSFVTPDQIYDILNATASRASSGYDPGTLNYLTNQSDRAFSSSIDAATLLGADQNQLGAIFDKKMQAAMDIGAKNQLLNMQNFENFLKAESVVADNLAAEQKSQQDIVKDRLQAAGLKQRDAAINVGSGLNAGLGTLSAIGTANLYKSQNEQIAEMMKILQNQSGVPTTDNGSAQSQLEFYLNRGKKYNPLTGQYE